MLTVIFKNTLLWLKQFDFGPCLLIVNKSLEGFAYAGVALKNTSKETTSGWPL